jgi:predicted nucleic acid-binding protein
VAARPSALICDTGALLDYLVASAADHRAFKQAINRAQTRYVPGLVLAELDYFLRHERTPMRRFMQDLHRGAFTYAPPAMDAIVRAMDIDERHAGLGLGLVDASIVALAEDLGLRRIATRDVRHFTAVRLNDGSSFELVVHPTEPERP